MFNCIVKKEILWLWWFWSNYCSIPYLKRECSRLLREIQKPLGRMTYKQCRCVLFVSLGEERSKN